MAGGVSLVVSGEKFLKSPSIPSPPGSRNPRTTGATETKPAYLSWGWARGLELDEADWNAHCFSPAEIDHQSITGLLTGMHRSAAVQAAAS